MHLGIDTKHLTQDPSYYKDAIVWTEWAIVMGTPYPTQVVRPSTRRRRRWRFEGRWFGDSGQINDGQPLLPGGQAAVPR